MVQETGIARSSRGEESKEPRLLSSPDPSGLTIPLVVDLDGTLVRTDLLIESIVALVKARSRYSFALPLWLLKGRAALKQEVARRISLDTCLIPYRSELVEYLEAQRSQGRSVVLATANDGRVAQQVADHLRLFDSVLASDGRTNLSGECKRERLVAQFGERGFDYVANEACDMAVWSSARRALVVNTSQQFVRSVARVAEVQILCEEHPHRAEYLNVLRPQHWLKNLLVLVPLFAAHRFDEPLLLGKLAWAFLAFCCCASSGYLFNDLFDLSADRHHPKKCLRPFAAGRLQLSYALAMIPTLLILGCVFGSLISLLFVGVLLLYYALTLGYSLFIKRVALLDVIVLAGLYTLRIMAGGVAVAIWPSEWLLAFSTFLFLSLALVKRYGELVIMRNVDGDGARARSYEISDAELLASTGTASGYIAVLVLALYITSGAAKALYGRHQLMWLLCPLLLYWVGHIWLVAHRGKMDEDPTVFAWREQTSRILILLMFCVALLAI